MSAGFAPLGKHAQAYLRKLERAFGSIEFGPCLSLGRGEFVERSHNAINSNRARQAVAADALTVRPLTVRTPSLSKLSIAASISLGL